jgi:hypothetical protein
MARGVRTALPREGGKPNHGNDIVVAAVPADDGLRAPTSMPKEQDLALSGHDFWRVSTCSSGLK